MSQSPYDTDFHPKDVIRRMALGETDVVICAAWGISKRRFSDWQVKHPEFKEAVETGYPAWEKAWLEKGEAEALKGNTAYFRYWATVMGVKAATEYRQAQKGDSVNVNINQMNVLQSKSETELLEVLQQKLEKAKIIDATYQIEQQDESTESKKSD